MDPGDKAEDSEVTFSVTTPQLEFIKRIYGIFKP